MIKIKSAEKTNQATVLELDTGDPKDQHFHVIPAGVLETRMEAWGLSEEEALELVLAEAHGNTEIPDRFATEDLIAARNEVKAAIANHSVTWGVAKSDILRMAVLPAEIGKVVREHTRAELATTIRPGSGPMKSLADNVVKQQEVRAGYERQAEERLADDIVAANPQLKKELRNVPENTVGLTVKYV